MYVCVHVCKNVLRKPRREKLNEMTIIDIKEENESDEVNAVLNIKTRQKFSTLNTIT